MADLIFGVDQSDGWETTCTAVKQSDGTVHVLHVSHKYNGEAEAYSKRSGGVWSWPGDLHYKAAKDGK